MTVRINKQKINLREKLTEFEDKVNFDEVVRDLGEYTGNVGIGTTNPDAKLHIYGDGPALQVEDNSGPVAKVYAGDTEVQFGSWSNHPVRFNAGASEKMRITVVGNVGIGTTSPLTNLEVLTSAGGYDETAGISTYGITINDPNQGSLNLYHGGAGSALSRIVSLKPSSGNSQLAFITQNSAFGRTEKMRIDQLGNVGIGTTSPDYKLEVVESGAAYAAQAKNTATNPFGLLVRYTAGVDQASSNPFIVCTDQVSARMRVYSDGDVWTSDSGTLTSDEQLKTNIVDATPKLEDIKKLKVRNFEWIPEFHPAKVGEKKIGFIAQELEEVFPGLVDEHDINLGEEEISRKSVRLGALIPILVKGMQEQQQIIEDLKSRIETLESK